MPFGTENSGSLQCCSRLGNRGLLTLYYFSPVHANLFMTSGRHRVLILVLLLFGGPFGGSAQTPGPEGAPALQQVGETAHPPIDEMSGIVRSQWQENVVVGA